MPRRIPKSVIEMLRAVPLFSECNTKELREIASIGAEIPIADGNVMIKEGAVGQEFFLLLEGHARCLIGGKQVAEFGPGDFFGEMALLEHGPRNATVVAEGASLVLLLDSREFSTLLDTSPSITRKLLTVLAERAKEDMDILKGSSSRSS
jgi:CRP/FNR family transcriptional regulator, cyclic AMP receptor protein